MRRKMTDDEIKSEYKRLWCEATGNDPDISDEEAVAAHKQHMKNVDELVEAMAEGEKAAGDKTVAGLPPDIARAMRVTAPPETTMPNSANLTREQRNVLFSGLVNEAIHRQGIDRAAAIKYVQTLKPDLCPPAQGPQETSKQQREVEENRRREVQHLINEKMRAGAGGAGPDAYKNCWDIVRAERKDLFIGMTEPESQR